MQEPRSATEPAGALADWRLHALAAVVVLLACSPILTGNWVGGHDEYGYLWRAAEFRGQLAGGELWPRWCPHFFWGFGYPFFVFYPPGVFALASAAGLLGLDVRWGLLLTGALGSGLLFYGTRRLGRLYVSEGAALFGATLATLATYRFVQLYVRGDQAEALATGLLPWILAEAVLLLRGRNPNAGLRLAAGVALISFTHTLSAVMTCGMLAVVGTAALLRSDGAAFLRVGLHSLGGLVLAAAYWVPVLALRPLVRTEQMMDRVEGSASYWWADHFPTLAQRLPGGFGFGPSVPGPADGMPMSTAALGWTVVLLAICFVVAARGRDPEARAVAPWLLGWAAIQTLLLPISTPLWSLVPGLAWFQFPWRFLLLELIVIGVIGALLAERLLGGRAWALVGLALLTAVPTSWMCLRHAADDPYPLGPMAHAAMASPEELLSIQEGSPVPLTTAGRNEYLPAAVERMPRAAPQLRRIVQIDARGAWRRFEVRRSAEGPLAIPTFDFPGVSVAVDGRPVGHATDERGVLVLDPPPPVGGVIDVRHGASRWELLGRGISALAWLLLAGLWTRTRRRQSMGILLIL